MTEQYIQLYKINKQRERERVIRLLHTAVIYGHTVSPFPELSHIHALGVKLTDTAERK